MRKYFYIIFYLGMACVTICYELVMFSIYYYSQYINAEPWLTRFIWHGKRNIIIYYYDYESHHQHFLPYKFSGNVTSFLPWFLYIFEFCVWVSCWFYFVCFSFQSPATRNKIKNHKNRALCNIKIIISQALVYL